MTEITGWILDLYDNQRDGINLWIITEDDRRICLKQHFPITFYIAGKSDTLRTLWKELSNNPHILALGRVQKQDIFQPDPVTAMQVIIDTPHCHVKLFHELAERHMELAFYDADVPVYTRHAAIYKTFPMAKCTFVVDDAGLLESITPLTTRWDIPLDLPPYKVMYIAPDRDPARHQPRSIQIKMDLQTVNLPLQDADFLSNLNNFLSSYDPDFLITTWGDNWLIPMFLSHSRQENIALALNRDASRPVRWQKETTYFSYGHIIYRPEEAHLYGRCHIDNKSAMMWSDYSLAGTLEMARVSALPIEKAARVSPGQGISAMQVITALERGILVPFQKQQVEDYKTGVDLIQSDRGGIVYQPRIGLHKHVAELDFVSMYPAVMIKANISPEVPPPDLVTPSTTELGLIPATLKPLYEKRVQIKLQAQKLPPNDYHAKTLKERASALKWLLVVCFGFLGYKGARYGKIESHEAVTAGGREILLQAKEVAEELGFDVLHLYVDALWVVKPGITTVAQLSPLLQAISHRTGLSIALDGIFRWIAFLPSKLDKRIPVANRFFGVFQSGEVKIRGLECRRRDTPKWIANIQLEMINQLAQAKTDPELEKALVEAFKIYRDAIRKLRAGKVPMDELVIHGKVSYALDQYKSPTAAVRAARQMQQAGHTIKPGQRVRYLHTVGKPDVIAWDLPEKGDPRPNTPLYTELLFRAGSSVLLPFGIKEIELREWTFGKSVQLPLKAPPVQVQPSSRSRTPSIETSRSLGYLHIANSTATQPAE